ncbi:FAD-dependent oxidoreductase [Pseudooceanicola onchidii]|uniref:FAD-dependent oxidoreductase n=1 Tax=Pseudooceanicola onchidii TaxID=2562279 RepID=UPI0010AB1EEF|nr:FAD-dependent oxidoreductase [Pseudooceanicola onchidii]
MIDVIVIGAGPTGLTVATELARRGMSVRIFDKKDGPSGLSRAVGVTARSIELLASCGAGPAIRAEAVRFEGMVMHHGKDPVLTLPLNFDGQSEIYGLPQDRTEAHLIDALKAQGVTVEYMRCMTNYHLRADHIEVEFGQHIRVQGRYLIGADGVHSRVRATAGIHFEGRTLPGHWSIADVISADWPHRDRFAGYLLPHGDVAVVVPMAPDRYRVIASRDDALKALPVPLTVDKLIRDSSFHIEVKQAEAYRKGNVFLAGDAAHAHSPVGGRGMNLGIADACDLAERLAEGTQDGYEAARHPEGHHAIQVTERARRMLQSRGAPKAILMAAIGAIDHSSSAKRAIVHQLLAG